MNEIQELVARLRSGLDNVDGGELGGLVLRMNEAADLIESLCGACEPDAWLTHRYDRGMPVETTVHLIEPVERADLVILPLYARRGACQKNGEA